MRANFHDRSHPRVDGSRASARKLVMEAILETQAFYWCSNV
jgi:hypothetical protein